MSASVLKRIIDSHFFYTFVRDPVAVVSLVLFLPLAATALLTPVIAPQNVYDTSTYDILDAKKPPMWVEGGDKQYPLGTDDQGRDMVSAILYGMRVSLVIGICATVLQSILGVVVGLVAGYYGGKLDAFLMRLADVQLSFSTMMVAIVVSAVLDVVLGEGVFNEMAVPLLIVIIGFAEWPKYATCVRASVLAEKRKEYVEAARVIGLPAGRIIRRHIFPNTLSPVLVISTVSVANAIMSEAALSFLGLGMPVTKPSLGSLIKAGFEYIFSGEWWITLFPGIILVVLILLINLLGDWLRDYLNPKLYKKM